MSGTKRPKREMPAMAADDQVLLIEDLDWGFNQVSDDFENIPERKTTWGEVEKKRATGLIHIMKLGGIDNWVVDQGKIVGPAGTPYGPRYFIVERADALPSETPRPQTIREALEFYRLPPAPPPLPY
jgi:hypothetical protein